MSKTIAVTGATGLVGSHVVRSLVGDGHNIIAFARTPIPPPALIKLAHYRQWDITEPATANVISPADVFIHTAGFVDFWGSPSDMYKANVTGVQHALNVAQRMGVKTFVYISSASVYDPLVPKVNCTESAPYAQRYLNYYAETKVAAEKLVRSNEGFESVVIIRPHAIYGPGDRTVVPQVLSRLRRQRFILPDSGEVMYSITHVGNIVHAIRCVLQTLLSGSHIFNITDAEPVKAKVFLAAVLSRQDSAVHITHIPYVVGLTAAHVLETSARLLKTPKAPPLTVNIMHQLHHESTMSNAAALRDIGYVAQHTYKSGLDDTFTWFNSLGGYHQITFTDPHISWSGSLAAY